MPRLKLTIAYDGTRLCGWQVQEPPRHEQTALKSQLDRNQGQVASSKSKHGLIASEAQPKATSRSLPQQNRSGCPSSRRRTVQGDLETAFAKLTGVHCRVHGASRTDAGVHAAGQVAHVDAPERPGKKPIDWRMALNHLLPRDIAVLDAQRVDDDFHARFDSIGKVYTYSLWLNRAWAPPWKRRYVWRTAPGLDLDAMDAAAARLVGEQDFAAFANAGVEYLSTVRRLTRIERLPGLLPATAGDAAGSVEAARLAWRQEASGALSEAAWPEQVWVFEGEGFLKQMVRNLMGCLVAVGRGKRTPEDVTRLLASGDRTIAPATAPAAGLCLELVRYC